MIRRFLVEIDTELSIGQERELVPFIHEAIEDGLLLEGGVSVTRIEPETISEYDEARTQEAMNGGDWFTARLLRLIDGADVKNRARIRIAFPRTVAAYERWFNG